MSIKFEKAKREKGKTASSSKQKLEECPHCQSKLIQSHLSDYKSLFIQENIRCYDCGQTNIKKIHYIN